MPIAQSGEEGACAEIPALQAVGPDEGSDESMRSNATYRRAAMWSIFLVASSLVVYADGPKSVTVTPVWLPITATPPTTRSDSLWYHRLIQPRPSYRCQPILDTAAHPR